MYVGQTVTTRDSSVRRRVRRHLSHCRSGLAVGRQLDVWEIAFVRSWTISDRGDSARLAAQLFHLFEGETLLVNGTVPTRPAEPLTAPPPFVEVRTLPFDAIEARRDPAVRFPRQVQQFHQLLDHILNTQDKPHLRRALAVHHRRLTRYLHQFLRTREPAVDEDGR